MEFDQDTSLRLVGEAIGSAHLLGDVEPIGVRSVTILDETLRVEALATSEDPLRLRAQAASVMGALSGLDVPSLFPVLKFTSFAVKLVDGHGEDVFWVISSPEDASFATHGAVPWLAKSIFQDNTPSYRRAQADRLIGQLEVGLRDLLHTHWEAAHGNGYAPIVLTPTLLKNLRKMVQREGEDELDDRTLLDFTMLPQLTDLLCDEALLVSHGCVADPTLLKQDLSKLNKIRRKAAHHRSITADDLRTLQSVVARVLQPVGEHHPALIADFLAERWDDAVDELMKNLNAGMKTEDPPAAGSMPEPERQVIAAEMLEQQLAAAQQALESLMTLGTPPLRQSVHDLVEHAFRQTIDALEDVAEVARRPSPSLSEARRAQDRHTTAMSEVRKAGEEIQRIRVMEHSQV